MPFAIFSALVYPLLQPLKVSPVSVKPFPSSYAVCCEKKMAMKKSWDTLSQTLESLLPHAQDDAMALLKYTCPSRGWRAIDWLVLHQAPHPLIERVVLLARKYEAWNPRGATQGSLLAHPGQWSVLHCSAACSKDIEILRLLIREFPASLHLMDGEVHSDGQKPADVHKTFNTDRPNHAAAQQLLLECTNLYKTGCPPPPEFHKLVGLSSSIVYLRLTVLMCFERLLRPEEPGSDGEASAGAAKRRRLARPMGRGALDAQLALANYERCGDVWSVILSFVQ